MNFAIDWATAPDWARWAARDASGNWWWHSRKPEIAGREWLPRFASEYSTLIERASISSRIHWMLSLTKRPREKQQ